MANGPVRGGEVMMAALLAEIERKREEVTRTNTGPKVGMNGGKEEPLDTDKPLKPESAPRAPSDTEIKGTARG